MSDMNLGILFGIFFGLILSVILLKVCNKNKKVRSEYDERQNVVRGRAYKYGFYAICFYLAIVAILPIANISLPLDGTGVGFLGIIIGIAVMGVYSIWNDAYWGLNNNRTSYMVVFVVATVINASVSILAIKEGIMFKGGTFHASLANLLCTVLFIIIGATLLLKKLVKGNATDNDEEDE